MKKHDKDAFLISMLVKNKDQQQKVAKRMEELQNEEQSVLSILKDEGYIIIGVLENEEICVEPQDAEFVDELMYEYFSYKENEWFTHN
ncbi:hypothetical protein [Butyrivibrio proteoclasticus]|uniref:hypothetical protein n=1 Tax=Butyrivibrio proteoclasticus TaxID=43305 RepID=UPI00047A1484|nr:hypothetical protein [Butyrivibrio proteoclasticus]